MDRSASGGMAPALQSSNHQSTDYLNPETETTRVEDIKLREKVNGNDCGTDTTQKSTVKHSEETHQLTDGCGDTTVSKSFAGTDMIVTEPCILTGLKETLPAVSHPAVHLGQGDGIITNNINHNGWGDCKKRTGGILQENNVTYNNHHVVDKKSKMNKVTCGEGRGYVEYGSDKNHSGSEKCENHPNGKIRIAQTNHNLLRPQSALLDIRSTGFVQTVPPDATTVTFTTTTATMTSTSVVKSEECENTSCSKSMDNPDNHTSELSESCREDGTSELQDSNQFTSDQMPHLPHELKYTDLLNSDLSKINMSHKLAHTLQELAASLKGTSLPLQTESRQHKRNSDIDIDTVIPNFQDPLHRSVKSLDFSINETKATEEEKEMAGKEHEARIQVKIKTAVECSVNLDKRLSCLKNKVDKLRLQDISSHIRKNFEKISVQAQDSSRTCTSRMGNGSVSGADLHSHPSSAKEPELVANFWDKIFGRNLPNFEQGLTKNQCYISKEPAKLRDNVRRISGSSVKKEYNFDDQRVAGDICGMDLDPIVQLTRVEQTVSEMNKRVETVNQAKAGAGILEKEFKYLRSQYDPDMTDSSSDEDMYINSQKKNQQGGKVGFKQSKKVRKSFCKWVAERAEISRRWTWLQSRISSLEFNIRQQGDLYTQLRDAKGLVQLEVSSLPCILPTDVQDTTTAILGRTTPLNATMHKQRSSNILMQESTPPCNVNQLLNNVHQSTRLLDSLSPLSSDSPSPDQPSSVNRSSGDIKAVDRKPNIALRPEDLLHTSARTRQLCLGAFSNRKLIKLSPASLVSNKPLKRKTVPNDSSIMCVGRESDIRRTQEYVSLVLKAAQHDHSYHTVISSVEDIPLSISMRAVMKSKRKWCKKNGSHSRSSSKSERKETKKQKKHNKKLKHKSAKKRERSNSMLPPNHLDEPTEGKRRKLSHMSDTSKKRARGQSFDSDMESPVVIGGFNSHQRSNSGAATPTEFGPSQNAYWKKKKSSEQAYDINNIVIPHGLNSARIEKLAYKEIQTPSWKIVEFSPMKQENTDNSSMTYDEEFEDISRSAFQCRHDHYEIVEKKKYLAYMEWSISRKGRGSRMSNIRGPGTDEPNSPSANPLSFPSEQYSSNAAGTTYTPSPSNPVSPSAKPVGVTTRRMSTDHNPGRPSTPSSNNLQTVHGSTDTSLSHSYSSPSLSGWHDGFASRRSSQEHAQSVNRTLSEEPHSNKCHTQDAQSWEKRAFPLMEEDVRMLSDVDFALQKLQTEVWNGDTGHTNNHVPDYISENHKRNPINRQGSGDKIFQSSTTDHTMSWSLSHDYNHKSMKRRRTDSRASSLASHDFDDGGRNSDASTASVSSNARRRKKRHGSQSHSSLKQIAKARRRVVSSRVLKAKRNYLHTRLSETDDSSSDSDSDFHSSDDTTTSYDDAGHLVDDFADPEWECNPRQKDRR